MTIYKRMIFALYILCKLSNADVIPISDSTLSFDDGAKHYRLGFTVAYPVIHGGNSVYVTNWWNKYKNFVYFSGDIAWKMKNEINLGTAFSFSTHYFSNYVLSMFSLSIQHSNTFCPWKRLKLLITPTFNWGIAFNNFSVRNLSYLTVRSQVI